MALMGNFTLPERTLGTGEVVIRTSRYAELPDRRITPADSRLLARIVTPQGLPAIMAARRSHDWKFLGLEVVCPAYCDSIFQIGEVQSSLADVPYNFVLDRVYIHGVNNGSKRAIQMNSAYTTVKNCWIDGIWSTFQDSQGIETWNGPGPFWILNNHIEASGENIQFGGAIPAIQDLIPSNITITGNHFYKPQSWKNTTKSVKNLLEFKNARHVTVQGNVFDGSWWSSQNGYAILFTVRAESGLAPWVVVNDILFKNNVIKNATAGINVLGIDYLSQGLGQTSSITIEDNLIDVGSTSEWGPAAIQILSGAQDISLSRNTILSRTMALFFAGLPSPNTKITGNVFGILANYGLGGDTVGIGTAAFEKYSPGYELSNNIISGEPASWYPPNNYFPPPRDYLLIRRLETTDCRRLLWGPRGRLQALQVRRQR